MAELDRNCDSKMKRILLITENLGSGGAERQICGLAVMLRRSGYACRLITYVKNQFYEPYLLQHGVDYEFVPELWNNTTRVFRAAKYVRDYKADAVISYLPSVNVTMCLAKLFFRAKLIVSERNNNVGISFKDRMQFNVYRIADAIVPNSQSQGKFIQNNFPFLRTKVHPIINFVDTERFSPTVEHSNNNVLRIVTVARYVPQKNILKYLEVIAKAKNCGLAIHFDWYGKIDISNEYYMQVEQKLQSLNIADYVTLHDSRQDVEQVYRQADVFCLPSLYEGYPNVIVEAMSSGLPIICSNRYENPYIVKDNVNGFLFNPEDINDIFDVIKRIVSLSTDERAKMGMVNRQICLERNSEEQFLHSYLELIENV